MTQPTETQIKLWSACASGNKQDLEIILEQRPCPDLNFSYGEKGDSPLIVASRNGRVEIVRSLLTFRAKHKASSLYINQNNLGGATALFLACQNDHLEVAKALLDTPGIKVNKPSNTKASPLWQVCFYGHLRIVKLLLSHQNIKLTSRAGRGATEFNAACQEGHIEVVNALLYFIDRHTENRGRKRKAAEMNLVENVKPKKSNIEIILGAKPEAYLNMHRENNATSFYMACQNNRIAVVELLLTRLDIDVNKPLKNGITAFSSACWSGKLDMAKLMLASDRIEVNKASKEEATPFFITCQTGQVEVAKLLLDHPRINLNQKVSRGATPFFVACQLNQLEMVKLLVESGKIDCVSPDKNLVTPIYTACERGHTELVEYLLGIKHIDPNTPNSDQVTPFTVACISGHFAIVKAMVFHGAVDINKEDVRGMYPLWYAAHFGNLDVVKCILAFPRNGVDPSKKTNPGGNTCSDKSAIEWCQERGNRTEFSELLEAFAADPKETSYRLMCDPLFQHLATSRLYALMRMQHEDFLALTLKSATPESRFFVMTSKLPIELQMKIANVTYKKKALFVPNNDIDAALRYWFDHYFNCPKKGK